METVLDFLNAYQGGLLFALILVNVIQVMQLRFFGWRLRVIEGVVFRKGKA